MYAALPDISRRGTVTNGPVAAIDFDAFYFRISTCLSVTYATLVAYRPTPAWRPVVDAQDLAQLEDKEFEQMLTSNIHPPTRDARTWAAIIHPDNLPRARKILTHVHERTASVLRRRKTEREEFRIECFARGEAGKREWFATRADFESLRRRTANFHQRVQRAITELGQEQRNVNRAQSHNAGQQSRETLRELAVAVQRHQAVHARNGGGAEQVDHELWQHLDRLTVPTGPGQHPTTLRTMLSIYWTDTHPLDDDPGPRTRTEQVTRSTPAAHPSVPQARRADDQGDRTTCVRPLDPSG
ncbi:hypothetical protein [Streptomyces sp. NPDC087511]|uniref:hypothetical protein n=1 Tax=Streptomyces sp. NPDC087511 TaxID=3365792 RepID=UPI0038253AD5